MQLGRPAFVLYEARCARALVRHNESVGVLVVAARNREVRIQLPKAVEEPVADKAVVEVIDFDAVADLGEMTADLIGHVAGRTVDGVAARVGQRHRDVDTV